MASSRLWLFILVNRQTFIRFFLKSKMNENTFTTPFPIHSSANRPLPDLDVLFSALAVAQLHVHCAVQRAEQHGLERHNPLTGLLLTAERVTQLANKPFGTALWSNGHQNHPQNTADQQEQLWQASLAQARKSWRQLENCHSSPLNLLVRRFDLAETELEMLLIALLPEFDPDYGRIFAYLQDDLTQKRPSVNLILDLLADDLPHKLELRRLLGENGRLHRHRLLHFSPNGSQPNTSFLDQTVQPPASLTHFLLGECLLDPALQTAAALERCQPQDAKRVGRRFLAKLQRLSQGPPPLLTFIGSYGCGRREAARAIAAQHGGILLTADLQQLQNSQEPFTEKLASLLRDGRLHAATLYLENWDAVLQDGLLPEPIWQALQQYPHVVLTASSQPWQPRQHRNGRPVHHVHFPTANFEAQLATWQAQLPDECASLNLAHLANLFHFTPGQIEDAVATAKNMALHQQEPLTEIHLLSAARLHSNQRLSQLATHITPRHTWDEIVLPQDTVAQLHELVQRVQHKPTVYGRWAFDQKFSYGKGVAALFVGESGTGKTMAADIIAGELGLDLYKIDLSALVSKYIGETEKNLERVFSEAATSNAILFFDEADAIFGKRGEINDSHDRYANLEVSYLLQRMERFEGIVILASNLQTNIDDAFTRRLDFIIEFPFPQKAERLGIWQVSLPPALPLAEEIDWELLASRFELAGGNIRNAVIGAAFLAAAQETAVQMSHFLHATRREYQKLGRLIDESLFVPKLSQGGAP